ncbi:hypothetical protein HK105_203589 [Polyrhizophydium stewartii]|uniref:Ribosomal RNA-processing protein 43 n=1 Tax=Polyrhizophydium stewartii TaxID=2732419 RepID=A0ABR4NBB5_9FUNG|nr:Exosome complex component RRP43 [Polyrhizophydium stewartii]
MSGDAATGGFVLDPDTFKKIQPLEYHRRFLEQDVRADGRPLRMFRALEFRAVPNIDLPALCSPQFRPGPPGELTQSLSTFLEHIISSGHIIDLDTLCVASGRAVWVLYADIICLNYAGNVLDAAVAALMAALRNVRLPDVTVGEDADADAAPVISGKPSKPIHLSRSLVSSTFGVFDKQLLLADPTNEEEALVSSSVSVVLDDKDVVCGVFKPGGAAASKALIDECIAAARERTSRLVEALGGLGK